MKRFEFIEDLKSDVLFKAYGKTLEELFTSVALALSSVICQVDEMECLELRKVEDKGKDTEDLTFNWLQKLARTLFINIVFHIRLMSQLVFFR